MNEIYYPAIFSKEKHGFSVRFPDLPGCYTQGDNLEEAYLNSVNAASLYFYKCGKCDIFPKPSCVVDILLCDDEYLIPIFKDDIECALNAMKNNAM